MGGPDDFRSANESNSDIEVRDERDERADIDVSDVEVVESEVSDDEEEVMEVLERADNGVDTVVAERPNDTFCDRCSTVSVSESVLFSKRLCGRVPNSDCCSGVR